VLSLTTLRLVDANRTMVRRTVPTHVLRFAMWVIGATTEPKHVVLDVTAKVHDIPELAHVGENGEVTAVFLEVL
jgi:hypothetical protein